MRKKNPKVLVVATSRKTHGGISAVVKAHEKGEQWKRFSCKWIETHIDKSSFIKIFYYAAAFWKFIFLLPFYSIVHIHFSWPQSARRKFLFFAAAKIFKKKIIAHLHSDADPIIRTRASKIYRYIFKNADVSVFLADAIKNKLLPYYIISNPVIIFNPCLVTPTENVLEISKRDPIILFAGSITKTKGIDDLIKAFSSITKKTKSWKLIVAGNGEINRCLNLARELNIENRVEFPGWISGKEKDELFSRASIFCHPSYSEGFPMAILDAWAYGLPVICTFDWRSSRCSKR
jgi:glycosyltransferase involved in cell wall biosynthesis